MAALIAVNVGMPKDVAWHGKTVRTGVWKQSVAGPVMARRLNLDGDGQGDLAGHGGEQRAVLVYQLHSYRHWQEFLKRDDFSYGQFGENLTVDGLADDEVCIGDRYAIGGAVFEVTQPRVTCYRVGLRLGEPQMAALLVSHRRPGFYMRVLTEGQVRAGDEIVKIASGPEEMTVAEIDALLYLPGHARRELERALRIPALSPGWQTSLQALLDDADGGSGAVGGNSGLATSSPPPAWPGFRRLAVVRIAPESASIFSLTLASVDGEPLPAALPGQFLGVRLRPDPQAAPVIRDYSLSGRPGADTYRISVKQEPHGVASNYLRRQVHVGDVLDVAAPRGTFCLAQADTPVLLLSAGVGATPVLAMLHALATARSPRTVWWLHAARNSENHPFADEARALLSRLPAGRSFVCYSRPLGTDRPGVDYTVHGRLGPERIRGLEPPRDADAYICGPDAFMRDMTGALEACGLSSSRIHTEVFGATSAVNPGVVNGSTRAPHQPARPPDGRPGPSVSFARSGLTLPWHPGYGTLLELAEACDVPVRWACRTGVCRTCETALLAGQVEYAPQPVELPAEGDALICCSTPPADVVLDL
ncbi:MOSC and FAD-binding oxidoreductase domain-containing protein [Kitasatospora sp. NBC_01266]|uniref:MOSC and FAD-binding oxidoreductase domain-containing protein n=1 Tax=Kitasatospora sp. NBC_01266 TaxID=2903572 RepID=UPI002E349307|nr:MOSC and FAD-binding oxidoreductase domain-containing protein [Kitasatospora sp. NBC_01266]